MFRCAIASNGRSSGGPERRWTSFLASLYRCAIWLVSMLAYLLVSVWRLVDSVPLLCTFLEVSTYVVVSALWLKPGSATVLELSFSICWKFCEIFLECVGMLSVVLPGMNVYVFIMPGVLSMSVHVIFSFPCRNCFPQKSGVFWIRWSFMCPCECSQSIYVCTSCPLNA